MKKAKVFTSLFLLFISITAPLLAQDRMLIVITNNKEIQATLQGKDTVIAGGYELSEVAEAYHVFSESGFEVDFMSPKGGKTYPEPEQKMSDLNKAFISNPIIKSKLENTFSPSQIKAENYRGIYFAGGKTMWDFPNHSGLATLVASIYEAEGIVGAVCHGPAALVNVKLSDGTFLVEGKKISSFTDREEQLFSKTQKFLPFFLQEQLSKNGAIFQEAPPMFDQVVVDQRLVTGQNPMSTYSVAEEMVKLAGKIPPQRAWTTVTYTLGAIKALVNGGEQASRDFLKQYGDHVEVDQEIFQSYSSYAFHGYLGDDIKEKGLALLLFATELFPESAKSYEALAKAYHQLGKKDLALQSLNKSLSIDADSPTALQLKKEIEG